MEDLFSQCVICSDQAIRGHCGGGTMDDVQRLHLLPVLLQRLGPDQQLQDGGGTIYIRHGEVCQGRRSCYPGIAPYSSCMSPPVSIPMCRPALTPLASSRALVTAPWWRTVRASGGWCTLPGARGASTPGHPAGNPDPF